MADSNRLPGPAGAEPGFRAPRGGVISLRELPALAARAQLVVLSGAGISADAGLPTFRGAGGLWDGQPVEELATPRAWARDPARVWRFYQERRRRLLEVEPGPAHRALVELERWLVRGGGSFTLISQNVDDLHQRAGSRPLSMHGQLLELWCEACRRVCADRTSLDPQRFVPCPACGAARLRPHVVWFGEQPRHLEAIQSAVERADWFLAIGTSGAVYPAAGLLDLARQAGAATLVQALEPPLNLAPEDLFLAGRSAELLPALVAHWTGCG